MSNSNVSSLADWRSGAVAFVAAASLAACGGHSNRNAAPTIATIADQTIAQDTTTPPLAVTVSDKETAADQLQVTLASSDPSVVATTGLALTGSGGTRSLMVTPVAGASGASTISLVVVDGNGLSTTTTFKVTVTAGMAAFTTYTNTLFATDANAMPQLAGDVMFTFDADDNPDAFNALFQ